MLQVLFLKALLFIINVHTTLKFRISFIPITKKAFDCNKLFTNLVMLLITIEMLHLLCHYVMARF